MLIKPEVDPKKEEEIDKLKDNYLDIQATVSELRKKGKDTSIAEVRLIEIPAKITLAKSTMDDTEIEICKHSIEEIRKDVHELTNGSDFDLINQVLKDAFEDIRKGEESKAHEKYEQIMRLYKLLTKTMKKTVISACIELHKRLS